MKKIDNMTGINKEGIPRRTFIALSLFGQFGQVNSVLDSHFGLSLRERKKKEPGSVNRIRRSD